MLRDAAARTQPLLQAILRIKEARLALLVGGILLLSVLYKYAIGAAKFAALSPSSVGYALGLALLLGAIAIAAWHRDAAYGDLWRPLRILMRGAGIVIFAQIVFDALYPSAWMSNLLIGVNPSVKLLIGIAFVTGCVAMWKPSFLVPMGLAYIEFRYHTPNDYGLMRASADFQTLNDAATFTAVSFLAWRTLEQHSRFLPRFIRNAVCHPGSWITYQKLAWAIIVGAHAGNYFHSALAKMYVGGSDPFFWIFNNPTARSIAIGLYRLNNPLAGWPNLVGMYQDILTSFVLPFNLTVLFLQLFAPFAVLNRRVLIFFTIAFDLMHIGIYFSLGAFFFLWIALNVIILLSLTAMRDDELTPAVKISAILVALFGYLSFVTAGLGWLDGRKVVRQLFFAELADGREALVPPATFGFVTYQIAHGDLFIPDNHFLMRSGGNATVADWADATNCGPATVARQVHVRSMDSIAGLVRASDEFYRRHPWVKDFKLYYLYPHHAPSNPAFFKTYDDADIADIIGYSYVVESSCLDVRNGRLQNDVRVRSEFEL